MADKFNTYLEHVEPEFWREMCLSEVIHNTLYDRYLDLHCKTPQQRYDELLGIYPDIFT